MFLKYFYLLFLLIFSTPVVAQDLGLISFHRFATSIPVNEQRSIESSSIIYMNYDSFESAELFFLQHALGTELANKNGWSFQGHLILRRYRPFTNRFENEIRPTQIVQKRFRGEHYFITHHFRFEQRFRDTYSNRWIYRVVLLKKQPTSKVPIRLRNEILYDFNENRSVTENRIQLQFQTPLVINGLKLSFEHRSKNLFSDNDIQHQLVLRTDYSF